MAVSSWNKILNLFVLFQLLFMSVKTSELIAQTTDTILLDTVTSLHNYIVKHEPLYEKAPLSYENQRADTTILSNFIAQSQQKYDAQTANYERRLNEIYYRFQLLLGIVKIQRDQTSISLVEVEQHLTRLRFQGELNNNCVQQYRNILVPVNTLRQQVNHCIDSAAYYTASILSSGENTLRILIDYLISNVRIGLLHCQRNHSNSNTNHTICVRQLIASTNTYFSNSQSEFETDMNTARYWFDYRSREAAECSFRPTRDALNSIGVATRLIDDCIANIVQGQCPSFVNYASALNFGNTTSCLMIDFMP